MVKMRIVFTVVLFICLFSLSSLTKAQQPFLTDDADVTDKGKFHFEISSEFDKLPSSSFPVKYQNGLIATLDYGLAKNVEISVSGNFLTLINKQIDSLRYIGGAGDTTLSAKYNFLHEHKKSRLPALAIIGFVQFPTGDASRALGSGVTDYGFYGAAQKTYKEKTVVRVNAGYLFAGNTLNGAEGISLVKGKVFTGGASVVRKINEKLQLGAEITGSVTNKFQLSAGQLQSQFGGNYSLSKKLTLDFGVIAGHFAASPRFGAQIGISVDF